MKIEQLYRLYYDSNVYRLSDDWYSTKEEAISQLENFKINIEEEYEWDDGMPIGGAIILQELNIEDIGDIEDYTDNLTSLSEWVDDEEATEEYKKDMLKDGIVTDEAFGKWEDKINKGEQKCI